MVEFLTKLLLVTRSLSMRKIPCEPEFERLLELLSN